MSPYLVGAWVAAAEAASVVTSRTPSHYDRAVEAAEERPAGDSTAPVFSVTLAAHLSHAKKRVLRVHGLQDPDRFGAVDVAFEAPHKILGGAEPANQQDRLSSLIEHPRDAGGTRAYLHAVTLLLHFLHLVGYEADDVVHHRIENLLDVLAGGCVNPMLSQLFGAECGAVSTFSYCESYQTPSTSRHREP